MNITGLKHQKGFTLFEVLVSIVVLSIGLLGLVGLQTIALRQNHSSQTRTLAVDFINELADRIRSNRPGIQTYASDPFPAPLAVPPVVPADPGFNCRNSFPGGGNLCNPAQMAQVDLYEWKTSVGWVFPGSQATVTCTDNLDPGFVDANGDRISDVNTDGICTDGSLFMVSLSWVDERNAAVNAPPANFRVTFVP